MSFESVEINLTPTEITQLITGYVKQIMLPESIGLFEQTLKQTGDLKEALLAATVNDSAVRVLLEQVTIEDEHASQE